MQHAVLKEKRTRRKDKQSCQGLILQLHAPEQCENGGKLAGSIFGDDRARSLYRVENFPDCLIHKALRVCVRQVVESSRIGQLFYHLQKISSSCVGPNGWPS